MVAYKQGISRDQLYLYQQSIDELVGTENIARFVDAYIDSLDMYGLGFRMNENLTGASAYRPQLKLKIYVYGYLNGIRSSRRLERECRRNVELIWLTERLAPDFKTIADFRKDNAQALKAVFKEFLTLCHKLELLSVATIAIDGTKMRGQNSTNEIYRREQMEKIEREIQEKIDGYLEELTRNDDVERESGLLVNKERCEEITKRLNKQVKRKGKVSAIKQLFEDDHELNTHYATDEESRLQSDKGKIRAGYNAQTAVDEKHKLIMVAEVTNAQNDKKQLTPMIEQIQEQKKALDIEGKTDVVADTGYFTEKEIIQNKDNEDCRPVVSPAAEGKRTSKSTCGKGQAVPSVAYENDQFMFAEKRDVFICPQNQELKRITNTPVIDRYGKASQRYRCDAEICGACKAQKQCTRSERGRMLRVSVNRQSMLAYIKSLSDKKNKRLIAKRKEIVEHPFGTIKRSLGYTYFLLKGLKKVSGEFNLICFTYNMKRVFNILGMKQLMDAIG